MIENRLSSHLRNFNSKTLPQIKGFNCSFILSILRSIHTNKIEVFHWKLTKVTTIYIWKRLKFSVFQINMVVYFGQFTVKHFNFACMDRSECAESKRTEVFLIGGRVFELKLRNWPESRFSGKKSAVKNVRQLRYLRNFNSKTRPPIKGYRCSFRLSTLRSIHTSKIEVFHWKLTKVTTMFIWKTENFNLFQILMVVTWSIYSETLQFCLFR